MDPPEKVMDSSELDTVTICIAPNPWKSWSSWGCSKWDFKLSASMTDYGCPWKRSFVASSYNKSGKWSLDREGAIALCDEVDIQALVTEIMDHCASRGWKVVLDSSDEVPPVWSGMIIKGDKEAEAIAKKIFEDSGVVPRPRPVRSGPEIEREDRLEIHPTVLKGAFFLDAKMPDWYLRFKTPDVGWKKAVSDCWFENRLFSPNTVEGSLGLPSSEKFGLTDREFQEHGFQSMIASRTQLSHSWRTAIRLRKNLKK
tara:strand:+ start:525 stop:1292 length:768 start_codon:yes stop_codon:yes gene_type:complete